MSSSAGEPDLRASSKTSSVPAPVAATTLTGRAVGWCAVVSAERTTDPAKHRRRPHRIRQPPNIIAELRQRGLRQNLIAINDRLLPELAAQPIQPVRGQRRGSQLDRIHLLDVQVIVSNNVFGGHRPTSSRHEKSAAVEEFSGADSS